MCVLAKASPTVYAPSYFYAVFIHSFQHFYSRAEGNDDLFHVVDCRGWLQTFPSHLLSKYQSALRLTKPIVGTSMNEYAYVLIAE